MVNKEMDKLALYLIQSGYNPHGMTYRYTEDWCGAPREQLVVVTPGGLQWDVICCVGSYGYKGDLENGKLEAYGLGWLFDEEYDDVIGWLTADDIIEKLETLK